jgi:hypothetical protein
MSAAPDPSPPKENARPGEPGQASFGKHADNATPGPEAQDSRLAVLVKGWMRATQTDRHLFLSDVRAGCPNLWRAVDREATGGRG